MFFVVFCCIATVKLEDWKVSGKKAHLIVHFFLESCP